MQTRARREELSYYETEVPDAGNDGSHESYATGRNHLKTTEEQNQKGRAGKSPRRGEVEGLLNNDSRAGNSPSPEAGWSLCLLLPFPLSKPRPASSITGGSPMRRFILSSLAFGLYILGRIVLDILVESTYRAGGGIWYWLFIPLAVIYIIYLFAPIWAFFYLLLDERGCSS